MRLTHSLAGDDYGLEEYVRLGQYLQLLRRRWFSGSCGRFPANGMASLRGLVSRRAWVELLQWYLKLD